MASTYNSYDIVINKELLVDPTFEKVRKFTEFFPIKFETINSRKFERLTNSSQILLLTLVSISYRYLSLNITVNDSQLPKFRRLNVVELFSELNDFGYLECPNIKEYKEKIENKRKNITPQIPTAKKGSSEPSENLPDLSANKTKQFISKYCELFKIKYGSSPVINGKISGIAKRLSESLGEEKSKLYLEAFFAMPDSLLTKNRHPLAQLEFKLNEVTVFANSGAFVTSRQAQQQDASQSNLSLLQKNRAGLL